MEGSASPPADPLDEHPWSTNPGRMKRDLTHLVDKISDRLRQLPAGFDVMDHGLLLERVLGTIKDGLKTVTKLEELRRPLDNASGVARPLAVAVRPSAGELSLKDTNRLANITAERDALRETDRLHAERMKSDELVIATLRKEIARLKAEPTRVERARMADVATMKARVMKLEDEAKNLVAERDLIAARLRAYEEIGSVPVLQGLSLVARLTMSVVHANDHTGEVVYPPPASVAHAALDSLRTLVLSPGSIAQPASSIPSVVHSTRIGVSQTPSSSSQSTPRRAGTRSATRATSPAGAQAIDLTVSPDPLDLVLRVGKPDFSGEKKSRKAMSKTDFERMRTRHQSRVAAVLAKRSAGERKRNGWPTCAPRDFDTPSGFLHIVSTCWSLGLFPFEQITPMPNEYRGILERHNSTPFALGEVLALYDTRPWEPLRTPPEPVTFNPADPRFTTLYQKTKRLYQLSAQVLWERSHFLLVAPDTDADRGKFLQARRKRNSEFSGRWRQHCMGLLELFGSERVDADLLLDPFFYWPPAYGVQLALPKPAVPGSQAASDQVTGTSAGRVLELESVQDCIRRLDEAEPARIYFRPPEAARHHPARSPGVWARIVGKFSTAEVDVSESAEPSTAHDVHSSVASDEADDEELVDEHPDDDEAFHAALAEDELSDGAQDEKAARRKLDLSAGSSPLPTKRKASAIELPCPKRMTGARTVEATIAEQQDLDRQVVARRKPTKPISPSLDD